MKKPLFFVETAEGPPFVIRLHFDTNAPMPELVTRLASYFEMTLSQDKVNYVVDMENVLFPSTKLIALLIATAARARLRNGDLKVENLPETAKHKFKAFNAWDYLIEDPDAPAWPSFAGSAGTIWHDEDSVQALAEIAEPPVVHELQDTLHGTAPVEAVAANPASLEEVNTYSLRVESTIANLYQLCDFVVEHAKQAGMNVREIGKIRIAVYEACLNVIEHAYHSNPGNWIDLSVHYNPEKFIIVIQDTGLSFQLKAPAEYDVQEAVAKRRTGGFGMHIIRRSVDQLEYHPDAVNGNRLIMLKNLR